MVNSTVSSSGNLSKVFDDWMMDSKRGAARRRRRLGDDWGWTKGQFLPRKTRSLRSQPSDRARQFLDAVWGNAIDHTSYIVQ